MSITIDHDIDEKTIFNVESINNNDFGINIEQNKLNNNDSSSFDFITNKNKVLDEPVYAPPPPHNNYTSSPPQNNYTSSPPQNNYTSPPPIDDIYSEDNMSEYEEESVNGYYDDMGKSEEELLLEKAGLLQNFARLKAKGINSSQTWNQNSNIEDMRFDYNRCKKELDIRNSIKFQRNMLMMFCSSFEYLNGQYDPLDIRLEGWAESVMLDIESYDDIFIELHEKYSGVGDVAPEIKLLLALGSSVLMYHIAQNTALGAIGRHHQQQQQFIPQQAPQHQQAQQEAPPIDGYGREAMPTRVGIPLNNRPPQVIPTPRRGMRGPPSGMEDIYKKMNSAKNNDMDSDSDLSVLEEEPEVKNITLSNRRKGKKSISIK